ncbi:MAG: DinB family protein [Janthinobacterium lividum]
MESTISPTVLLAAQYQLVQAARAPLLDYCASLAPAHFVAPVAAFRQSSIRDLLVHTADSYRIWLGRVALGRTVTARPPAEVPDVAALRQVFGEVDALVLDFQQHFDGQWLTAREFYVRRQPEPLVLTPLQLFTHVTTHEFHHKGQVLTMSRLLGYEPVDTDIIRF